MRLVQISSYKSHRDTPPEVKAEYEGKCLSCGACCSYYAWQSAKIAAEDGPLMGNSKYTFFAIRLFKYVWPNGVFKVEQYKSYWLRRKREGGWWKCIALKGNIGQAVSCSVYADRPSACRDFEPGSEKCKQIREWAGLETQEKAA
jgi:Fe-S-cluster containining protein